MQGTFHQYHLIRALTIKHSHATYLAFPSNNPERQVRLTVFAASLFPFPHDRETLLHKAQEIQALEHPYLLPILDLGIEDGQPFVVREYLPLGSLHNLLSNLPGQFELQAALTIILQVGEALVYAHKHHVLHRNLKPGNILFDTHGHALLTDFSLITGTDATIRDQATEKNAFCYLAPEQLAGTCDARSDQYALGCLTYELLTGQAPFVGQRLASIMAHPSQAGPQPLSARVADLPPSLEAAVLKTLAKDPVERFADCTQFLDVIRSVLFETTSESPVLASEQSLLPLLPQEATADVQPAHTTLAEQETEAQMSLPASSLQESNTSIHSQTTSQLTSPLDQPEPYTRPVAGSRRKPIVLALVISVILALLTSAFCLAGIAKPATSVHPSNQGTRVILVQKQNIPTQSPPTPTPTPSAQDTSTAQVAPPPAAQPPLQATRPPTTPTPAPTPTPPPSSPTSYEAEAPGNTLANGAQILNCSSCSGGYRVGYLGQRSYSSNGFLQFNNINKQSAGTYTLTIYYTNGASYSRDLYIDINGGSTIVLTGDPTGSFSTVATLQTTVILNAGTNTLTFYNPQDAAPDIDKIVI